MSFDTSDSRKSPLDGGRNEESAQISVLTDGKPLPELIVFDLDYTIWPYWIDVDVQPPVSPPTGDTHTGSTHNQKRKGSSNANESHIVDARKQIIRLFPDMWCILHEIRLLSNIKLAIASRTHTPDLARKILRLMRPTKYSGDTVPKSLFDYFDYQEIYPGTKLQHFRKLHRDSHIPYNKMLFFDDELRNREVEQLGVTMQYIESGMSLQTFSQGINLWRLRHCK